MTVHYLVGDVFQRVAALEDGSVDLVLTSPPFLALRSYLPPDHPDKPLEIGSEATPGEFIDRLLDLVEALAPKLAGHGSMCFELGDTYSGSGGAGGDYKAGGMRDGQERFDGSASRAYGTGAAPRPPRNRSSQPKDWRQQDGTGRRQRGADEAAGILTPRPRPGPGQRDNIPGWPLSKSLCLVPELFRVALVYGFNPLNGRTTPRWRARNVIRWCRPNPPVGALGDKVRPATSDMVVICAGSRRYFDLDAVRTEPEHGYTSTRKAPNHRGIPGQPKNLCNPLGPDGQRLDCNPAGAPPLDHWWHDEDTFDQDAWLISTQPYRGSHYATWPEELLVKPILAMCPVRVCRNCGKPSERITGEVSYQRNDSDRVPARLTMLDGARPAEGVNQHTRGDGANTSVTRIAPTIGWTECGCPGGGARWRPGHVLDPFAGSGTTLAVAQGHGRDATGIDLDHRNLDLARQRVGMFLETDELERDVENVASGGVL